MGQNNATIPQQEEKPTVNLDEVKLHLDNLTKDVNEVKKQFNTIQRSLEAIYEDRDLLTDIGNDIGALRALVINVDKHTGDVKNTVEQKAEEVKAEVGVATNDAQKNVIRDVVKSIGKNFKRQDASLKKHTIFRKLFNLLTFKNKKDNI